MRDGAPTGKTRPAGERLTYQELLGLARDRSHTSRTALFEAISDLAVDGERKLTATDRILMRDIIAGLIGEVETSVRRALAQRLAGLADVPRELIVCLANDEISVARPLLLKSTLLRDPELIEIIQHRTMEHQVAIAMRPALSETVSDALVWTGRAAVIETLLENRSASISDATLEKLADASVETPRYQAPLLGRDELPPRLARKLYWTVSAALRAHIVRHFDIDPDALDDTIEGTIETAFERPAAAATAARDSRAAGPARADDRRKLMRLFERGEATGFVCLLARLSGLRTVLVRRMLFEPGGEGTAAICRAIGLEKEDFAPIFLRFRQGRLGDKRVEVEELTRALGNFDRIAPEDAREVVRRWRRNPEFLNALRVVEESGGPGE